MKWQTLLLLLCYTLAYGQGFQTSAYKDGSVTLAKMASAPANTVPCNNTGSTAVLIYCTQAQITAQINVFSSTLKGLVPASGGGTVNFLRADGTWAAPAGGGGAPTTATYITQTADATLSAEQALSALATGAVLNTTTTGVLSIYGGVTCTNQFLRVLSASIAGTCASVGIADLSATGTPSSTTFLRGDNTWSAPTASVAVNVNGGSVSTPNFSDTTPAPPAGGANNKWQVSGSDISSYDTLGDGLEEWDRKPFLFTECILANANQVAPWLGSAVSSGTIAAGTSEPSHPGICSFSSSTTANSGYRIQGDTVSVRLDNANPMCVVTIFKTPAAFTGTTARWGFLDSTTSAAPVDGVYFEFSGSGVTTGKATTNTASTTTTGTSVTLVVSTWYRSKVCVLSTTSTSFQIWNASRSSLWLDTGVATNIPNGAGRETSSGVVVTNSGTTAVNVFNLDYMALFSTSAMTR